MKNRLNLDWALTTSAERSQFINNYITSTTFANQKPTPEELETMANYVLWGKDPDGLNPDQRGEIEMPRKYSTWASQNIDSLDEKRESPTFIEGSVQKLGSSPPLRKPKETFSRILTRQEAPPTILPLFEELWERIDYVDLVVGFYEERVGKRKKPPREELLRRLPEEELNKAKERANSINQHCYLKLKHLLVELRKEQYTLRDTYGSVVCRRTPVSLGETKTESIEEETSIFREVDVFEEEVPVFPLGVMGERGTGFWRKKEELVPENFGEEEKKAFSEIFWRKVGEKRKIEGDREDNVEEDVGGARSTFGSSEQRWFDFRELEMVYQLLLEYQELDREKQQLLQNTSKLIGTLFYYMEEAELNEIQRKILRLKMDRVRNQDIASQINGEYGKSYTANYISTIFRQKIIPEINGAAALHARLIESLPFEEEFKRCNKCGRILLRDPINFVRKSRAKDGLSSRCKKCDKLEREKNKK